jgi:hypothetical protein
VHDFIHELLMGNLALGHDLDSYHYAVPFCPVQSPIAERELLQL